MKISYFEHASKNQISYIIPLQSPLKVTFRNSCTRCMEALIKNIILDVKGRAQDYSSLVCSTLFSHELINNCNSTGCANASGSGFYHCSNCCQVTNSSRRLHAYRISNDTRHNRKFFNANLGHVRISKSIQHDATCCLLIWPQCWAIVGIICNEQSLVSCHFYCLTLCLSRWRINQCNGAVMKASRLFENVWCYAFLLQTAICTSIKAHFLATVIMDRRKHQRSRCALIICRHKLDVSTPAAESVCLSLVPNGSLVELPTQPIKPAEQPPSF